MPNDIDTLMSYVHEINAKSAAEITDTDIPILIAYHRHNRARRAAGHKTLKPERPKIDVLKMLGMDSKPAVAVASSGSSSGLRRICTPPSPPPPPPASTSPNSPLPTLPRRRSYRGPTSSTRGTARP